MKKISIENIVRAVIVIVLIAFASTKYGINSIIIGLFVILGMILLGVSMVKLYTIFLSYLKTKKWGMDKLITAVYLSIILIISLGFILLLPPNLKIYFFLIVGLVLFCLFIVDVLRRLFK